jgi:hypothetical protein
MSKVGCAGQTNATKSGMGIHAPEWTDLSPQQNTLYRVTKDMRHNMELAHSVLPKKRVYILVYSC